MFLTNEQDKFINLSNYALSKTEKEVLNLGLNCHLQRKFDQTVKRMEIEILYQNLTEMEKKDKVII